MCGSLLTLLLLTQYLTDILVIRRVHLLFFLDSICVAQIDTINKQKPESSLTNAFLAMCEAWHQEYRRREASIILENMRGNG